MLFESWPCFDHVYFGIEFSVEVMIGRSHYFADSIDFLEDSRYQCPDPAPCLIGKILAGNILSRLRYILEGVTEVRGPDAAYVISGLHLQEQGHRLSISCVFCFWSVSTITAEVLADRLPIGTE